jgi:hypothetical protein
MIYRRKPEDKWEYVRAVHSWEGDQTGANAVASRTATEQYSAACSAKGVSTTQSCTPNVRNNAIKLFTRSCRSAGLTKHDGSIRLTSKYRIVRPTERWVLWRQKRFSERRLIRVVDA